MIRGLSTWLERFLNARIADCTTLRVTGIRDVTPHMRRVSFSGQGLDRYATNENLHVKLLLPPAGAPRDRWLRAGGNGLARLRGQDWQPLFRKYTIRSIDPRAGLIEIDFVLHEDGGPGALWAAAAAAGDVIGMIGPGGLGMRLADWCLLAGDETALPAIGRIAESLPREARGVVLVEIDGPDEEQMLDLPEGMSLRWLHRNGAAPGTTCLLADAVAAVDWPDEGHSVFAWAAAEFEAIRRIRAYLKRDRKLGKQQQLAVSYWRRDAGTGERAHGE